MKHGPRGCPAIAVLCLFACALSLAGCKEKSAWRSVDQIQKAGEIRLGVYDDRHPFSWRDDEGVYQGFNVLFAQKVAEDLGVKVTLVPIESSARLDALQAGLVDAVDVEMSSAAAGSVLLSLPYVKVPLGVVTREVDHVTNVADLYGKRLIVVDESHAETFFTYHYPDIELLKVDNLSAAIAALQDGRGEAVAGDGYALYSFSLTSLEHELAIESLGEVDALAIAVHKDNTRLLNWINGEIRKLSSERFFHEDYEATLRGTFGPEGDPDRIIIKDGLFEPINHPHPSAERTLPEEEGAPRHWRTIEEIKRAGEIRFAVLEDNPPFTYEDKDGEFQGCNVYFAHRLAQDLKVDIKFLHVDFVHNMEDLDKDLFDVAISNFTMTEELSKKIVFSSPYMRLPLSLASSVASPITSVEALSGKKLIVVKNSLADIYFTEHHPDVTLLKCDQFSAMFSALEDRRGEAVAADFFSLLAWTSQNSEWDITIDSIGEPRYVTVAVHKGNTQLLSWINGEMVEIGKERFFHKDFEATLRAFCGPDVNADMLVIENGQP